MTIPLYRVFFFLLAIRYSFHFRENGDRCFNRNKQARHSTERERNRTVRTSVNVFLSSALYIELNLLQFLRRRLSTEQ